MLDVSVVVKGPQFEKAVNMYARKMISDLNAADQHAVSHLPWRPLSIH